MGYWRDTFRCLHQTLMFALSLRKFYFLEGKKSTAPVSGG
jgi:hypothetical protein